MDRKELQEVLDAALKPLLAEIHTSGEHILCVALALDKMTKILTNRVTSESFEQMKAERDALQKRLDKANTYFKSMRAKYPKIDWLNGGDR